MKSTLCTSSYFTTIEIIFSLFPIDTYYQGACDSVMGVARMYALDTISIPGFCGSYADGPRATT